MNLPATGRKECILMKRGLCVVAASAAAFVMSASASADTIVPGDSSVRYAVNANGFYVDSNRLDWFPGGPYAASGDDGTSYGVYAGASDGSYADAGIVLYFDGSLTLGQLQNIDITTLGGVTPSVNLWLDAGGDNQFFDFSSGYPPKQSGLDGDGYFGATASGNISGSTMFTHLGGAGSGVYSLSDLQSGVLWSAVNEKVTIVALWLGVTSPNGNYTYSTISQVGVGVAAVPLPAAALGGLALFGGIGGIGGLKRLRRRCEIA
jgi:hypothetical protein